jgi:hypothetical protein
MPRCTCLSIATLSLATLGLAALLPPSAAQQPGASQGQPGQAGEGQSSQQPNSDYGSGGHAVMRNDMAGAALKGTVYDSNSTIRHEETNTYTTTTGGGPEHKTEWHAYDFDPKGHLQLGWDFKYDLRGGLNYSDITHYGLHGERTAEEVTNYRTDGFEIKDWSIGTHQWYSNFTPYKAPLPAGTAAEMPLVPTNFDVGVLLPRSYLPGETITGSLWPAKYAENFKVVPGLTEYSFPIELYHLPDGSPQWSSLEIGVKGDGYLPVNPNGTFSLHIPYDWKGPLELQARQPDPVAGAGPASALLNLDTPTPAPALTNEQFSSAALSRLHDHIEDHLVDLWEDACDLEETLDALYDEATPDWARIYEVEDELDDTYDDIDDIDDLLPPREVIQLAQEMYSEAGSFHDWLNKKPNPNADDIDDLKDSSSWMEFLDDEIGYNKSLAGWAQVKPLLQPYWTNPVLTQGRLGEIGGNFSLDPNNTFLHIDNFPVTPLAATPNNWYFMPPPGLTAGLHNYIIDSPLYSETIFPVFSMTLTMSADSLNLLKGQSTTYHVTLDGLNGLPGGAWGGSLDPSDLVGSSELNAAQQATGSSRTGFITLSVANGSPGVIAMQDQFRTLDASSFAPSGSFKLDGGVTALVRGGFVINGVARAYLDPEVGVGVPPGTTSGGSTPGGASPSLPGTLGTNWYTPFSLNYDPAAFSNSSFMKSCPGSGAAPAATAPTATGGAPGSAPCVESVIGDLMPPKTNPQVNEVQDNSADLTQLADVARRADDALRNLKAADALYRQLDDAEWEVWKEAVNNAPKETREEWEKTTEGLHRAEDARSKMKGQYKDKPNDDNASFVAAAEQDVAEAERAEDIAVEKLIDSFNPGDRKRYEAAHAANTEARKKWEAARDERRAADEALEKLKQTAGLK